MPWNRLLSSTRGRSSQRSESDSRAEFERDYDRLAFCSAFRRLQDKAQVFPLNRGDFVRTRLTHSMAHAKGELLSLEKLWVTGQEAGADSGWIQAAHGGTAVEHTCGDGHARALIRRRALDVACLVVVRVA